MNLRLICVCCSMLLPAADVAVCQSKTHAAKPQPKISHYMQVVGLDYTERLAEIEKREGDSLDEQVARGIKPPLRLGDLDDDSFSKWEDHIEINVTSAADREYLELLKRTREAMNGYLSLCAGRMRFADKDALIGFHVWCKTRAYDIAKSGELNTANCTDADFIKSMKLWHESEEDRQAIEALQIKCKPFVGRPYSEWPDECEQVSAGFRDWKSAQRK